MSADEFAKTVAEALVEEARFLERGYEDTIQTADVKWCVPDLIVPQRTELVAEFSPEKLDTTDGRQIAAECRGVELVRPRVSGKTQARIEAQISKFGEELIAPAPLETVDSATQQIVEIPREDTMPKKTVGQTFARPEAVPDVFGREPKLEPLSVVCGEDRATEQVTSPLQSAATKSHAACWTFAQVEAAAAEETGADVGRAPSPEKVGEVDLVHYDFSRTSVGVQHTRAVPFTEYHSESEEEDLYLEATEIPQPVDVEGEELRRATVHGRQLALTTTLQSFTEPEVAEQSHVDGVAREEPKMEECQTVLSSASRAQPTPSRAVIQLGAVAPLVVDGPFEDATKSETAREPVVVSASLEPARVGQARPSLAAPLVELVAFDGAADFDEKLESDKSSEVEVADEFCRTLRREGRPLTKVLAIVELVPQERTPAGHDDETVADHSQESTVTADLERAQIASSWVVRARQQIAVVGAERTGDLADGAETENTSESVVDHVQLQTKSGISNYPLAYVVGAFDRASPEKIIEHDDVNEPETGREVVVSCPVETATVATARPSKIEPQVRHLSTDVVDEIHVDVSLETSKEEEVAAAVQMSSKLDRPLTKVLAVVELVAQERAPHDESGEGFDTEIGTETVVPSEMELVGPKVSEVDVQQMPVFEELIGPMKIEPEREAPTSWPTEAPIDGEDVEKFPCEEAVDLCAEEPTYPVTTLIDVCLAEAKVDEPIIYLEEMIIEEIVIHVKKDLLLMQYDSTNYAACEEYPLLVTHELTSAEMTSVVPVVVEAVPLSRVEVNECEVCSFNEETMIEEVVIELRQIIEEAAIEEATTAAAAAAASETSSISDEETMIEEVVIETHKMIELLEAVEEASTAAAAASETSSISDEETMIEEVVVETHKMIELLEAVEEASTAAAAASETSSISDEETMIEEVVIETHKMIELLEAVEETSSRRSYSETCSLPQTIVHHVEATARLLSPSPPVSAPQLASIEEDQIVGRARVDECTVFQEEEETFSETVCEQKIAFETRAEVL
jgi:hypothetical protein